MAEQLQPVRGTFDLLPQDARLYRLINDTAFACASLYGYGEIVTPIFEMTNVFQKTLGDTSDIVNKEMYTFTDRGGDSITLRPEGTAPIARSIISNGLAQNLPLKLYYFGPMFRYERPQKGRYRQFYQVGVECLGIDSPLAEVECLSLAFELFKRFKVLDLVKLEINSLGDQESRAQFRTKVVEYFSQYKNDLSADSLIRLEKNPLRILDSKDPKDKKLIETAPQMQASLTDSAKAHFEKVIQGITDLGFSYHINEKLVRGLDYYCHTVFEFTTEALGAQGTVLAGGRYDGLIHSMGGPQAPGIGWASGVDRLALLLESQKSSLISNPKKLAIIIAEESATATAMKLGQDLRSQNFEVEIPFSGNVGKRFKRADKVGAEWALVIGSTELNQNSVTMKNLKSGTQTLVPFNDISNYLRTN